MLCSVTVRAVLCRAEAQKLWRMHQEIEKQGVKLVCVVKEWIKREVRVMALCVPARTLR